MLEAIGITKQYQKKQVLDNVSFALETGKALAVVGDNGAGKSTLMQILASMITPSAGDVLYKGQSLIADHRVIRRVMGYVPQEITLHPHLRVIDNLRFWADMSDVPASVQKAKIPALAERFELAAHLKTPVSKLSGGMRRKLNICVSLFRDPEIVFMDEPTANVDAKTKAAILDIICQMKQEGKTIVYITHLADEAEKIADTVLRLDGGRTTFFGEATQYFGGGMF